MIRGIFLTGILSCLLMWGSSSMTAGHGDGASFEAVRDAYRIDVGYVPASFETGVQTRFDFLLQYASSSVDVPFTDVWVQLRNEHATLFAGGISRARIGSTGMSFVFMRPGVHEISVRFHDGSTALVEHTFTFFVEEGTTESQGFVRASVWWALCGFFVGGLLVLLFFRRP